MRHSLASAYFHSLFICDFAFQVQYDSRLQIQVAFSLGILGYLGHLTQLLPKEDEQFVSLSAWILSFTEGNCTYRILYISLHLPSTNLVYMISTGTVSLDNISHQNLITMDAEITLGTAFATGVLLHVFLFRVGEWDIWGTRLMRAPFALLVIVSVALA